MSGTLPFNAVASHSTGRSGYWYRWYVLGLLWLVAVLRFVDLQILAVLLEPIRRDLQFSDTQLALLGGLAFALFYSTLGLPIAWLADRSNRRNIIATAVTLWSLMTALCGQATGFVSLFLARMGVGIGEAGAYPPTTALLADYFPPEQRARACSILASAIPVGVGVGFLVGGLVTQHWGWRAAFTLVGLPGMGVGLLVLLTLREPRRSLLPLRAEATEGMLQGIVQLWRVPAYRLVVTAACLFTLGAAGSGIWIPTFFMRHHGLDAAQTGLWMALLYGLGGLLGALAGGWLTQWLQQQRGGDGWAAWVCALSLLAILPLLPLLFLHPAPALALTMLGLMAFLMHMNSGPLLALLQLLGGPQRRALAHAFSMLVTNLVALPLGPLFIGMASDYFGPRHGSAVLGPALLLLLLLAWSSAALCFCLAAGRLQQRPLPGLQEQTGSRPSEL
jgi:predicted MFS family arabinose efflux permease